MVDIEIPKNPGFEWFSELENKPINQLKSYEIRLLNVCSVYEDPTEIDACVRGFINGVTYIKEQMKKVKK